MSCRFIIKFPESFLYDKIRIYRRHNKNVTTYKVSGFPHLDVITHKINCLIPDKDYLLKVTPIITIPESPESNIPKLKNALFEVFEITSPNENAIPASFFYHSEFLPSLTDNDNSLFYYGLSSFAPVFFMTNIVKHERITKYQTKINYLLFYLSILCDRNSVDLYFKYRDQQVQKPFKMDTKNYVNIKTTN